ncbi:Bro-N domain-containing protein [Marinomonas sp. 5E14-1]|uniref:Bro-N domain-containing protein n=1 Tax=Marinomonas sp. 5E14-1 TaxID=3153922 RepID=UPI0032667BCD
MVPEFPVNYLDELGVNNEFYIHNFNGQLYFSLKSFFSFLDECKYENYNSSFIKSVISSLDSDEYTTYKDEYFVNQPGIYRLLANNHSPRSKKLIRWLHHEVVPSLTKFGVYPPPSKESFFTVIINTDGGAISLTDFSIFLNDLNSVYKFIVLKCNCSTDFIPLLEKEFIKASEESSKVMDALSNVSLQDFNKISSYELSPEQELSFINISRRNPIEIVFSGISIALVVALIVSGGKFELGLTKLKIELPPLGEGLVKIKKALSKNIEK